MSQTLTCISEDPSCALRPCLLVWGTAALSAGVEHLPGPNVDIERTDRSGVFEGEGLLAEDGIAVAG